MQIVTADIVNADTINIRTGKSLDLRALSMVTRVCNLVKHPQIRYVVIDLKNTRHIRDSGLAMLMLLRQRIGKMVRHITIVNCRPELKERLSVRSLTTAFQFAKR
jgi:anti-anti-sigma regulatory factor